MEHKTNQVKAFFDQTDNYLNHNFSIRLRSYIVRDLLGKVVNSKIIDVGCGDGSISMQYLSPTNHITLLDLSDKMLDIARQNTPSQFRGNVSYLNTDFLKYEPDCSFDIAICLGVLAHVESVHDTVKKVADMLRLGGRCVLQFTDQSKIHARLLSSYYSAYRLFTDAYKYEVNRMSFKEVNKITIKNHLQLESKRQYSFLLPGMGRLPDSFLYRYQLLTLHNRVFSRFGSEMILLMSKREVVS